MIFKHVSFMCFKEILHCMNISIMLTLPIYLCISLFHIKHNSVIYSYSLILTSIFVIIINMSSRQVVKKIFANFENSNDGVIRQGITKWVSCFFLKFPMKIECLHLQVSYIFFWINSGVTMSYWTRSCRLLNFLVILITLECVI